ncbi:MAG: bifunctional phosphopantothenoylcysteine decarboxylase/phosphopantothenate--cysteine ligase CoaBC [Acidobacteriota bacterium]|nr:bifunctional phosphopantothenoylcysteine decarboxylase/phosphopantothenate--cysteine ligase CoaBC [Acidobacteriota bacterium]
MTQPGRSEGPGRIVLGVTGGIAAYKTAELARLLTKAGYDVVPIMTPWGARFLGPLTLEALTGHPVRVETPAHESSEGIGHISLIRSAELLLIAPLTANTMAKMVTGMADNFLTATYLAHRGKTLVCPAMNTGMLEHPATRRNLAQLAADGVAICMGEAGDLACGEVGAGRMAEPDIIMDAVRMHLTPDIPALVGRSVLVSAGPTREDLDPVRYLTNRSSGKMGFAVARALRNAGARVTLVHGPGNLKPPIDMEVVPVTSAAEMEAAILPRQAEMDLIVMAAAVADYRPQKAEHKLKKGHFDGTVILERTTDILASLGAAKRSGQVLAGFAAESEDLLSNARGKLERKNLDLIFANDISGEDLGFGGDHNRITALDARGHTIDLGTGTKDALAGQIVRLLAEKI